jgi:hypothetical protein
VTLFRGREGSKKKGNFGVPRIRIDRLIKYYYRTTIVDYNAGRATLFLSAFALEYIIRRIKIIIDD